MTKIQQTIKKFMMDNITLRPQNSVSSVSKPVFTIKEVEEWTVELAKLIESGEAL